MKKHYVYRQSYSRITVSHPQDLLSYYTGSSLNRKSNDNRKKRLLQKAIEEAAKENNKEVHGFDFDEAETDLLPKNEKNKRKVGLSGLDTNKLPKNTVHVLSARSKKKIRNKLYAFYGCYHQQTVFATLTFIATVNDTIAVKVLNKFLTVVRKMYNDIHYLWVAERQENGNIHFHIMLSTRVNIDTLNALWVLQQYNSGIEHSNYSKEEIITRFRDNTIKEILNPFDVEPITCIDGLAGYVTSYVTKNNAEFECRIWACSRSISELFTTQLVTKKEFDETLDVSKNWSVDKKTGEVFEGRLYVHEHGLIVNIFNKKYFKKNLTELEFVNRILIEGKVFKDEPPKISFGEYVWQSKN